MKTTGKWIGLALMVLIMINVQAMAQNGGNDGASSGNGYSGNETSGDNGGGYGADEGGFGNGECQNIRTRTRSRIQMQILSDAIMVEIEGVVVDVILDGNGLIIATEDTEDLEGVEDATTTVYGIGPQWYWDLLGVSKPDFGEQVYIQALKITLKDESERIIATTITIVGNGDDIADIIIPLRDEDGRPLWRRGGYDLNS